MAPASPPGVDRPAADRPADPAPAPGEPARDVSDAIAAIARDWLRQERTAERERSRAG